MNPALAEKIRQCPNLPTLPSIAVQVLNLAQRADVDIAEIARLISKDPALSGKILRTVNSSFYGRSQHVSTISQSLVILGLQSVKTLVLGFSLVTNLSKNKAKGFKHLTYWRRSIYGATAARTITAKIGLLQQEETFLVALLMDIGMLVLDQVLGDAYGEIHAKLQSHAGLSAAEQAALGLTHAQVGGMLAEQWKLPPILTEPITYHHTPEQVQDPALRKLTEVVETASRCADVFADDLPASAIADVRDRCMKLWSMTQADADALLNEIGTRTKEVASLFEVNIGSQTSYEAILKKANEALVDLTLASQQQNNTLIEQNVQLKRAATTDALSGLGNRATFDEFVAGAFAQAAIAGGPVSLLMLDIDKFKLVNDKHGHPAGDAVIRHVSKLLSSAARASDLAARYGGEELTLVLPGTPRAVATGIAESIRRTVAAQAAKAGAQSIPVTVSIGVASFEPGSPFREPAHLIKAADLAVYAAKRGGRNCVKVFSTTTATAPVAKPAA